LQGLTPTLAVVDELHAHKDEQVYLALRTALLKRPGAKMAVISTAAHGVETPLGRLRARALAGDVRRHGVVTDARTDTLRMLEWMARDDRPVDDMREAWRCNPASWITEKRLREQYEALPEIAWRRFHLNQWAGRLGSWLPGGAWAACANGTRKIAEGAEVWVGLDVGGARADTALVWIDREGTVECRIWSGDDAIMDAAAFLPGLAQRYRIRELVYDPWRAQMLAKAAEQHRIKVTAFPQSDSRMIPASAALREAVKERRIHHPNDEKLNAHVAAAVAKHGRRGWRIDQAERGANIDGLVALVMAYEAMTAPEPPRGRILGVL
jgi:phage terminase large subunit-like protein